MFDSLWPAFADELWHHIIFSDILGHYCLVFENLRGVCEIVYFPSLGGLANLIHGSMLSGTRRGLLNAGSDAWILELDTEHFSFYPCDLRFYDRYVDHAADFEWAEFDLSEQEKETNLIIQVPRALLREKLLPMGERVLELLEAAFEEETFERLIGLDAEGMRDFFKQRGESARRRLREVYR